MELKEKENGKVAKDYIGLMSKLPNKIEILFSENTNLFTSIK